MKQGLPEFVSDFAKVNSGWDLKIHGGGADFERLRTGTEKAPGVILNPVLEESEYIQLLLNATACLVTQRPGVSANFLPSKILPALAAGTPVLAVCDADSPLGREVREGRFGAVIPPKDSEALSSVLEDWRRYPAKLSEFSAKAAERAKRYHRQTILPQYEEELKRLTGLC
jgi:colanic acid biosynthesis glycosyl transferase WcaI